MKGRFRAIVAVILLCAAAIEFVAWAFAAWYANAMGIYTNTPTVLIRWYDWADICIVVSAAIGWVTWTLHKRKRRPLEK